MLGGPSWTVVLALVLVGCANDASDGDPDSDVSGDTDVAGGTDAPIDTEVVSPDLVTLTVLDPKTDAPDANEAVLFFDAAGTFVVEVQTDADGKAAAELPAGGIVVYMLRADDDALPYLPTAWFGVEPGDALVYDFPSGAPDGEVLDVTVPELAGVDHRWASSACDDVFAIASSSTRDIDLYMPPCDHADVLVSARDADNKQIGLIGKRGIDADPIEITDAWALPAPVEVEATGVPAGTEDVAVDLWQALGAAQVPGSVGGHGAPSAGRFQATGNAASWPDLRASVWVTLARAGHVTIYDVVDAPYSGDVSVDVAPVSLPWITAPTVDPTTREVAWSVDGARPIDVVFGALYARRDGVGFAWSVVVPEATTSFVLPHLPEPWTDYDLRPTDDLGHDLFFVRSEDAAALTSDPGALDEYFGRFARGRPAHDRSTAVATKSLP